MSGAGRKNDNIKIHNYKKCWNPSKIITFSNNVFVNSINVIRDTDKSKLHKQCNDNPKHIDKLIVSNNNVYVNSLKLAKIGNKTDKNSSLITGSNNVFVG